MIHKFKNLKVKEFSVTKATLESQMFVCPSITKTLQPLRIIPVNFNHQSTLIIIIFSTLAHFFHDF